jgi:putative transposase
MIRASGSNTGRHVVFLPHAHLVFSTRYRRGVLTDRVRAFLHPVMAKICTDFEATLEAFEGADDHVHLLVCHSPKVALSTLVNSLKGAPSRPIRKEKFPKVTGHLWGEHFRSPRYCVGSCGAAPLDIIKKYIARQRALDRKRRSKSARCLTRPQGRRLNVAQCFLKRPGWNRLQPPPVCVLVNKWGDRGRRWLTATDIASAAQSLRGARNRARHPNCG